MSTEPTQPGVPSTPDAEEPRRPSPSSRLLVVIVTVVALVAVAVATIFAVRAISPNPSSQAATSGSSNPGAPYGNHPVVINLPDHPASYIGAFAQGVPAQYAPVQSFVTVTGVRPNVELYYSGWGEPFQTAFARQVANNKGIPLVQIEPGNTSLVAIAAGAYDHYLETYANAVASFGAQTKTAVIIGFGHEPNGTWYPWGSGHVAPAIWVAAWRHVVDVFRHQGADDVTWLWTVNIINTPGHVPSPAAWWPGNSYVTWVGIDGYYYKPSWTFASLFGPTIKAVRALTVDPILISETAVAPAANKPAKIADLFAGIRAYGSLGFVWFDADRVRDWRLNTAAAAAAFRQGAKTYRRLAS